MKAAESPPSLVPETSRQDAESNLANGEASCSLTLASAPPAVEQRRPKATFHQRADVALAHYRRTGEFHPAGEVVARLQARLDAQRKQLCG